MACSSDEENLRRDAAAHFGSPQGTAPKTAYRLAARLAQSFDPENCDALAKKLARNKIWNVPILAGLQTDSVRHAASDHNRKYLIDVLVKPWSGPSNETPEYGELFKEDVEIVRLLHKNGVPLMTGTDSPVSTMFPGFAVHQDMAELVNAGLTPIEALRAATLSPASFLGMNKMLGSIAPGKLADLVLLDANPLEDIHNSTKIQAVISGGRFFDRKALDRVLEGLVRRPAEDQGSSPQYKF